MKGKRRLNRWSLCISGGHKYGVKEDVNSGKNYASYSMYNRDRCICLPRAYSGDWSRISGHSGAQSFAKFRQQF